MGIALMPRNARLIMNGRECAALPLSADQIPETSAGRRTHVLVVDDDPAAAKLLSIMFRDSPIACTTAGSAMEALTAIERQAFEAVISDLRMPGMSGLELLAETRQRLPYAAFVVTTGVDDLSIAVQAMHHGADDYLVKPLTEETVLASLKRALRKRRVEQEVESYQRNLEKLVSERTAQLNRALEHIQRSYEETLRALGTAIDLRDGETAGHSWRVYRYSLEIAEIMSVPEHERSSLARAAYLHDIGKLGVPDSILLKPGPLSAEEWITMRQHVQIGFDLLKTIPFLADSAEIVLAHHERFDGDGYPRRLSGHKIPLGARIFSVADAFDAITSHRPYRSASSFEMARDIVGGLAGSQFDPLVVQAFLQVPLDRWREIGKDGRHVPPPECDLANVAASPL
jgi:response regulator RpfG family c-di-GMP phosphodiesterase